MAKKCLKLPKISNFFIKFYQNKLLGWHVLKVGCFFWRDLIHFLLCVCTNKDSKTFKQNTVVFFSLEVIYHKINRDVGHTFLSEIVVCSPHVTSQGYRRGSQVHTWGNPTHILWCHDFNFSVAMKPNSLKMKETIKQQLC